MNYCIGDRIVYPMHGAGIISSIEEREVIGQIKEYYCLELPYGNTVLMIPVDCIENNGVRSIINVDEIPKVLEHLRSSCIECSNNWNKRQRDNLDKLKTGNIYDVADVYKALVCRDKEKSLSTGEKKMLTSAKNILYSELILCSGKDPEYIDELVNSAMEKL